MSTVRAWLQREPHPVRIRCTLSGGDEKTVRIGDSRSRWRDAAAACAGAVRLEAVNDAGETLRVLDLDGEGNEAAGKLAKLAAPAGGESQLAELGRIISEAADASALRHAEAYRLAYEQQALLVGVLSQRLQALERAWHRLLMSSEAPSPDADPNAADPTQAIQAQMVMQLLSGALSPPTPPMAPTPPKPNGKAS